MEKEKCGFAIVGYGGMGAWHGEKMKTMSDIFDFCGVYDINPDRNALAQKNGIGYYDSFEALLEDKKVKLITVAIPNDLHKSICVACMKAGKNVICEKPVTLSSSDLEEMIAASNKYGVLFTVHQNRRWDEDFLIAKQLLETNRLGNVFNIESRVHGSRGIPGDWRNKKEHGGGMVLDWGVHLLDQILNITDKKIVSVWCHLTNVTNTEVDDGFKTVLTFENGLTAHVEVGTSNFINLPRWYIQGENGSAVINDFACNGKITMVSDWENRDAVPVVTAAGLTKTMAPRTDETISDFPLPRIPSDVRDFYRNMYASINKEATPLITHNQLRRSMKLMEALFESSEKDEVIHTVI